MSNQSYNQNNDNIKTFEGFPDLVKPNNDSQTESQPNQQESNTESNSSNNDQ